jgi:hypothetical protein
MKRHFSVGEKALCLSGFGTFESPEYLNIQFTHQFTPHIPPEHPPDCSPAGHDPDSHPACECECPEEGENDENNFVISLEEHSGQITSS